MQQLIQVSGVEDNSVLIWTDSVEYFSITPEIMKELRGGYLYMKPTLPKE
ncbi:MAG: hypothetical protein LUD15_15035 [Bacteroides sp.]|nr:hypothetical protein [Bacteroides sp.]